MNKVYLDKEIKGNKIERNTYLKLKDIKSIHKEYYYFVAKYLFEDFYNGCATKASIEGLSPTEARIIYKICKKNGQEWLNELNRAS